MHAAVCGCACLQNFLLVVVGAGSYRSINESSSHYRYVHTYSVCGGMGIESRRQPRKVVSCRLVYPSDGRVRTLSVQLLIFIWKFGLLSHVLALCVCQAALNRSTTSERVDRVHLHRDQSAGATGAAPFAAVSPSQTQTATHTLSERERSQFGQHSVDGHPSRTSWRDSRGSPNLTPATVSFHHDSNRSWHHRPHHDDNDDVLDDTAF